MDAIPDDSSRLLKKGSPGDRGMVERVFHHPARTELYEKVVSPVTEPSFILDRGELHLQNGYRRNLADAGSQNGVTPMMQESKIRRQY